MNEYLLPNEPVRFTPVELDRALLHCVKLGASDVTMQSNSEITAILCLLQCVNYPTLKLEIY